jgi:chaperonin GroEL (HSP60 family)
MTRHRLKSLARACNGSMHFPCPSSHSSNGIDNRMIILDEAESIQLLKSSCLVLHDIASKAYGPNGRPSMLQSGRITGPDDLAQAGSSMVTSCSSRFAQGLRFTDRFSALLMQATVTSQNASYGDGGLLSLLLASRLILDCLASCKRHASRLETLSAYTAAANQISELASPGFSLSIKSSGIAAYVAVANSALGSKVFAIHSQSSLKKLSILIVESFLSTFDPTSAHSESTVKSLVLAGLPQDLSFTLPSLLVNVQVPPNTFDLLKCFSVEEAKQRSRDPNRSVLSRIIALFDISLEPSSLNPSSATMNDPEGATRSSILDIGAFVPSPMSPQDAELKSLLGLVRWLHKAGVRVIASQKLICEQVQQLALELGMLPIHRLSIFHIQSVANITGAIPISSIASSRESWSSLFGLVGDISIVNVGHKKLLHFEPPRPQSHQRARAVQSLVLGATCELQAEDLRASIHSALKALSWVMHEPFVLPGGGSAESMIAGHLRRAASTMNGVKRRAFEDICLSLESAASLVVGSRQTKGEVLAAVQSLDEYTRKQQETSSMIEHIGWDSFKGQFGPVATSLSSYVISADLLDVSVIKVGSILTAIEAACMMLRVNGAIFNTKPI